MPLVDYGSSGESSDEEQEKESEYKIASTKIKNAQVSDVGNSENNIFSSLPKPRGYMALDGKVDQLKNLLLKDVKNESGNKKESTKIIVPSLSDFNDDDDDDDDHTIKPKPKKIKPSANAAGLLSVLPPPRNGFVKEGNVPLIPQVVKNQLNKTRAKFSNVPSNIKKGQNSNVADICNSESDPTDDDSEIASTSYFGEGISTSSQNSLNDYVNCTTNVPASMENQVPSGHLPDVAKTVNLPESYNTNALNNSDPDAEYNDFQQSNETLELDDKALQILCGGKRKRNQMPVNIIDLSGEEIMPDSKEWLLKQLTEEKSTRNPSHKKANGPSVQSRRKHQITYLAFQAKAQELELQNQWSNNRMSRRQTQSKYGF